MFGKPGRPREDVFLRRLEIYTAVAPLLEKACSCSARTRCSAPRGDGR